MTAKVLVAFATRYGSAADIAAAIGAVLMERGLEVDVLPVTRVDDVSRYDAAVIGSPINGARWLPQAVELVRHQQFALRRMPVAYFAVCVTLREDTEKNRSMVLSYLEPVQKLVPAVDIGLFAGVVDRTKLSRVQRLLFRLFHVPEGDFRDWPAIRTWAAGLADRLAAYRPVAAGTG